MRQITLLARQRGAIGEFSHYTFDMVSEEGAAPLTPEDVFNTFGHTHEIHDFKVSDEPHSQVMKGFLELVHYSHNRSEEGITCCMGKSHMKRTNIKDEVTCPRCQQKVEL